MTKELTRMQELPILKHFETTNLNKTVDSFRKGEKGMFNIFKLVSLAGVLYCTWIYILPRVFKAIGQTLAVISSGLLVVLVVLLLPVILKAMRRFTRFIHKLLIKHNPFTELEEQKEKMKDNKRNFQKAQGKIKNLQNEMEVSAAKSEKDAHEYKDKVKVLTNKAKAEKETMDKLISQYGPEAESMDDYVFAHTNYIKTLSQADRVSKMFDQQKDFVQKYGSRAAVMKKFSQKLLMVETQMDIKISDFDATIDILKKDYEFAQKSREATDTAKSAMLFTEGWELEYALDVVTSTIAEDIAITTGNLKDIDMLTANYATDSDELYAKLDSLSNRISQGVEAVPVAKNYSAPNYKLTHDDKLKSGGFGKMF